MGKILVGKTSDIPSGKMIMVSTDGKDILVTNLVKFVRLFFGAIN